MNFSDGSVCKDGSGRYFVTVGQDLFLIDQAGVAFMLVQLARRDTTELTSHVRKAEAEGKVKRC